MNFYEVLSECGKISGVSARAASLSLGHNEGYIATQKTMKRDTSVSNAARILGAYGFGLYAMPLDDAPQNALQITASEE